MWDAMTDRSTDEAGLGITHFKCEDLVGRALESQLTVKLLFWH